MRKKDKIEELMWELTEIAAAIHYPECWDTATYPTLLDAVIEIGCNAVHKGEE